MELLKFNDAPKSARRGKNPAGFIGAGIMVAVMGLSSTLAGTITINAGTAVEFGQGVVNTAACDSSVKVTPSSSFNGDTFTISSLTFEGIGVNTGTQGAGCKDVVLEVRVYDSVDTTTALVTRSNATGTVFEALTIYIPASATGDNWETGTTYVARHYVLDGGTISTTELAGSVSATGSVAANTQAATGLKLVVSGLSVPASAGKITIESRAARDTEKN